MRAQARHRQPVRQQQMMTGVRRRLGVVQARGVQAAAMPQVSCAPGLVQCHPPRHAVAQSPRDHLRVVREGVGCRAVTPATALLQRQRQIPVKQGGQGRNPVGEQRVHQSIIEVQPALVDGAGAFGDDARPRDGEAIGVQAQLGHQRHVLVHAPIVIGRHEARLAAMSLARRGRKDVPNGGGTPILCDRPLDLIGRGCRAPKKVSGEGHTGHLLISKCVLRRS